MSRQYWNPGLAGVGLSPPGIKGKRRRNEQNPEEGKVAEGAAYYQGAQPAQGKQPQRAGSRGANAQT